MASSQNKEAAWELLRILLLPEIQRSTNGIAFPVMKAYYDLSLEELVNSDAWDFNENDAPKIQILCENTSFMPNNTAISDIIQSVIVNIHSGETSDGRAIYVTSFDGDDRSNTLPAFKYRGTTKVEVYSRYDDGRTKNIGWSMAHEFGHCLGLDDYYTHDNEAWYNRNFISIMHRVNTHAQLIDIILAIQASKTGKWQLWS